LYAAWCGESSYRLDDQGEVIDTFLTKECIKRDCCPASAGCRDVPRKDDPNVTSRASPKNDSYVNCVTDEDDEGDGDRFCSSDKDSELFEYDLMTT
jgi:hypothetical protein